MVERQQGELEIAARGARVVPPIPGGEAQEGAQGGQGADGAARERSEEDARGQARRGARVGGEEDLGPPGPEGGGQQGAQGAPRRRRRRDCDARTRSDSRPRTSAGRRRPGRSKSALGEAALQRETELRAYTARLKELEAARLAQKSAATEDLEQVVERFGAEISDLRKPHQRTGRDPARVRGEQERPGGIAGRAPRRTPRSRPATAQHGRDDTADEEQGRPPGRRRGAEDTRRGEGPGPGSQALRPREESRRNAEALRNALENLGRLSDPERRLREGIALFNESEHASTVASISTGLRPPEGPRRPRRRTPGKPTLTFLWGDMAWRRYVSDPTEGVEEPRVYLTGTGEDPTEVEASSRQPNARMDSKASRRAGLSGDRRTSAGPLAHGL